MLSRLLCASQISRTAFPLCRASVYRQLSADAASIPSIELPDDIDEIKPPKLSMVGVVVSDKMDKSVVVKVSRLKLYTPSLVRKKTYKKIMAHDENNACVEGDVVRIKPCRPVSKHKRFTVDHVLRKDPKLWDA